MTDNSYCVSLTSTSEPGRHCTLLWLGNKLENLSDTYLLCSGVNTSKFSVTFNIKDTFGPPERRVNVLRCPKEHMPLNIQVLRNDLERLGYNASFFKDWHPHITLREDEADLENLCIEFDRIDITCTSPDFNILKVINLIV